MVKLILKTDERIMGENFESENEYLIYLRHLFAYKFATDQIPENSFILEIGSGSGFGTKVLFQHTQKIIGLDVDKNIIEYASRKYGSENCVFKRYSGLKIPYSDSTFDAVVSFQVIEHIQNDIGIISEIYRVLKDNGIFILTTPNRIFRGLRSDQKPLNKFHVREYSVEELDALLKNKFLNIEIWGIRANETVQKIERKNMECGLKIASFDPLRLRKLMPRSLRRMIFNVFLNQRAKNFLQEYDLNDYYMIKNNIADKSIDLIGFCKK